MGVTGVLCAAGAVAVGIMLVRRLRAHQWGHCTCPDTMDGKVAVVTGASSGLGRESALELARRGATVVLACRDGERAAQAQQYIRARTDQGELVSQELDLADFDSIKQFAHRFCEQFDRLDLLMNNAGVAYPPHESCRRTVQGYELHFGVNHLGHYMLTGLLLTRLQAAPAGRVVVAASGLYRRGRVELAGIASGYRPRPASGPLSSAYADSKLCNVLFSRQLAAALADSPVHVYAVCPGWVYTGLFRHAAVGWLRLAAALPVALLYLRSVSQGVQTQLHCAVSGRLAHESGHIYADVARAEFAPSALDAAAQQGLWELSEQLTGVRYPAGGGGGGGAADRVVK